MKQDKKIQKALIYNQLKENLDYWGIVGNMFIVSFLLGYMLNNFVVMALSYLLATYHAIAMIYFLMKNNRLRKYLGLTK